MPLKLMNFVLILTADIIFEWKSRIKEKFKSKRTLFRHLATSRDFCTKRRYFAQLIDIAAEHSAHAFPFDELDAFKRYSDMISWESVCTFSQDHPPGILALFQTGRKASHGLLVSFTFPFSFPSIRFI